MEETITAVSGGPQPASSPDSASSMATVAPAPALSMLRLAYAFEFLLALLVTLVGWTQVGGQAHMDLMPWYVKLICVALLAWCGVRLTAAMVEQPKAWNRSSRLWLGGVLLAGIAIVGVTWYVHLHEVPDEPDTDETSTTSVRNHPARHPDRFS